MIESNATQLSNVPKFSKQQVDRATIIFAQTLAKALTSKEVRQYFKSKISERFDGDFDMLYIAHKNDKVISGKTLSEVLYDAHKSYAAPKGDDECGESIVEYCDHVNSRYPSDGVIYGERYNTGTVQFEVRERY
jgi:hypothetical protein